MTQTRRCYWLNVLACHLLPALDTNDLTPNTPPNYRLVKFAQNAASSHRHQLGRYLVARALHFEFVYQF